MDKQTQCPPETVLSDLIDGKIVDPDLSDYSSHLEGCPDCQGKVKTLFPSDTLVRSLRDPASKADSISDLVPVALIDALKRIPAMDSDAKLSADGLRRDHGMSLDNLGLSFLSPPQQTDEIGRLGHYRILQVLGRGGMGVVFLAEDPKLGRKVALKVMLPKIASIPAARDRFLREAKSAASLKNDHIVTVYQVDEFNGVPFLAMELLHGESLEDALRDSRHFSMTETIHIVRDIARGLADAHEKGLVHRDIKPANLWLEQPPNGSMRVKILDFGLARLEVDDMHITEFGTIVGTPAFMAPEQARADRPVDAKADLFSLGCVLYVLCTGTIPFRADTTVGTLMALALNTPVRPDEINTSVPANLSQLTMDLLEKDPAQRPESARHVIERLCEIDQSPLTVRRQSPGPDSPPYTGEVRRVQRSSFGAVLKIAFGLLIAVTMFLTAQVFFWKTPDGKVVRIESNDPSIMLAFGGGELKVTGAYDQPVTLTPGKVDLKITKPQPDGTDFEFETDKLVIRKGDAIVLKIEVLDGEVRLVHDGQGMIDSKPLVSGAEQFAMVIEAMKKANPGFDGAMVPVFEDERLVSLEFKTDHVTDISPLRELKHLSSLRMIGNFSKNAGVADLSPLAGLPLTELILDGNVNLSDLAPLKGMPLQQFFAQSTQISDLLPLAGMPLKRIGLWAWLGSDLTPLKGMPLTELNVGGNGKEMDLTPLAGAPLEFLCINSSNVSDLAPLKGMPLKTLMLENTLVSDLSPLGDVELEAFIAGRSPITDFSILRGMPLKWIKYDIVPERDLEMIRELRTLERINDQRATDVLKELTEDPQPRPVPPAFTNSMGMEFVRVPKGKAWLARKVGESETTPNHETVFEEDFFLGMYEVTQDEWLRVMGTNPSWFTRKAEGADTVSILPDDLLKRLPVERVSWSECQQFLRKLNELDSTSGWTYRLPTEAEWQYACRGGPMKDSSEGRFEFCTTDRTDVLTIDYANTQHSMPWNRPCRVGVFPPNRLGLYDMHGNVWEWCDDAAPWRDTPSRFIHGGGWNDPTTDCGASHIKQPTEPWVYYDLGLRIARVRTP